jgi:acyl carrier protein
MTRPSRKPEGVPIRCPSCEAILCPEPVDVEWTAPCPYCGRVLWLIQLPDAVPDAVRCYRNDEVSARKREKIRGIVRAFASVPPDSLDFVELVLEFEEFFGFRIPDREAERMRSLGDLLDYIILDSPD